jgi:multimeric flavodoxin WrbA
MPQQKMKKVVILSASPRLNGNSDTLAKQFKKGAEEEGNSVELIELAQKKINFCHGCYYCASHDGHCCQQDDAEAIIDKMVAADVLVFATPTYFYSMDAQLKALIDRSVMKYTTITEAIRGFTKDCLPNAKEKGVLYGIGVNDKGDVEKTQYPAQAYEMGRNC